MNATSRPQQKVSKTYTMKKDVVLSIITAWKNILAVNPFTMGDI